MKFVLVVFILSNLFSRAIAQNVLTGNTDGRWFVHASGENKLLPQSYYDVGNFDNQKKTYFAENGAYGILDFQGHVVLKPQFIGVEQLGGGFYMCLTDSGKVIVDLSSKSFDFQAVRALKKIEDGYWVEFETKDSVFLLNTISKDLFKLHDSIEISDTKYGYLRLKLGENDRFYDGQGSEIVLGQVYFFDNHIILEGKNKKEIIYADHIIEIPLEASILSVTQNEIIYSNSGHSYLINPSDGTLKLKIQGEAVQRISNEVLTYRKKNLIGLVNNHGRVLTPAKYYNIGKYNDVYKVWLRSGVGVLSSKGDLIVPCLYNDVRKHSSFYKTISSAGFFGLYSTKSNKELLKPLYNRIKISEGKIRAWTDDNLRILFYEKDHQISNSLILSNTITVNALGMKFNKEIDTRLYSVGWFVESKIKYDNQGFMTGESRKWGLANMEDSILIPARFPEPKYVPLANFGLVPMGKTTYSHYGEEEVEIISYAPYNLLTGKIMLGDAIFTVDTNDLYMRRFNRFASKNGIGIIREDNSYKYYDYIDRYDDYFIRVCSSKTHEIISGESDDLESVQLLSFSVNNKKSFKVFFNTKKGRFSHVHFVDGEWNFLDTNGMERFEEDFDFVFPFHRGTAICKKKGRWGVVNADTIVLGFKFSQVSRFSELSDTIFLVKKAQNGVRYLDSLTKEYPIRLTGVNKVNKSFVLAQVGTDRKILDHSYQTLSGSYKSARILNDDVFYVKQKKEYLFFDKHGDPVGVSHIKPERIFHEYSISKVNGKYGVSDLFGDTMLNFKYKRILDLDSYLFARDDVRNLLYDREMRLVLDCKKYSVTVDRLSGMIALNRNSNVLIYNSVGEKTQKVKDIRADVFVKGLIIELGKNGKAKFENNEAFSMDYGPIEVEQHDEVCLIRDKDGKVHYYYDNWQELKKVSEFKSVKYIGEGFCSAKSDQGLILISSQYSLVLPQGDRVVGEFNSGFLLISDGKKSYYLNTMLENQFQRTYRDAQEFKDGFASVKEHSGWTIIDHWGYAQSLPSFQKITVHGAKLFSTRKQALYGLYDSHGQVLVEPEFDKITLLYDKYIQAIKNGEIYYFDLNGKPIELNPEINRSVINN